jgi:hypothetical protein
MALVMSPAKAELINAHIAIMPPSNSGFVDSISVSTMSYVTNSPIVRGTYIEILGSTATGPFQLRIQAKDPARVLAYWDQIAQATYANRDFQITVYAVRTFQVGEAAGYVGDLDIGWNYFLLN